MIVSVEQWQSMRDGRDRMREAGELPVKQCSTCRYFRDDVCEAGAVNRPFWEMRPICDLKWWAAK